MRILRDPRPEDLGSMVVSLAGGGVWAFPTDTVWGIGCRADLPGAVARIYEMKGRAETKPMACLVESLAVLEAALPVPLPAGYKDLAAEGWPGALTLVLELPPDYLPSPRRGAKGIGFRMPAHPTLLRVIRGVGGILAATSANRSGEPVLTSFDAVRAAFGDRLDGILDAPPAPSGAASRVVVWSPDRPPEIVRR